MEIECKRDELTFTLTRDLAEALAEAADIGSRVMSRLELVQRPAATESAVSHLRSQLAKARGKTVTIGLRVHDASLVGKAVDIGLRVVDALSLEAPEGAVDALVKLRYAIRIADRR